MNKTVVVSIFFSFLFLSVAWISPVQSKIVKNQNEKHVEDFHRELLNKKNIIPDEINLTSIVSILENLTQFTLALSYAGYGLFFVGKILAAMGFELIGYRLSTFGMRWFIGFYFFSTICYALLMILDVIFDVYEDILQEKYQSHLVPWFDETVKELKKEL